MKIKISYLVNKVINREEMPKEVLFNGNIYKWCDNIGDYRKDGWGSCLMIRDIFNKFDRYGSFYNMLFEDVEIIEEDKKIENFYFSVYQDQKLGGRDVVQNLEKKINELIDEVNKLKEK